MRRIPQTACVTALVLLSSAAVWPAFSQVKGDRELGAYISTQCVTCHQASGQYEGIPSIVGWPEESFIAIIDEYRHKKRSNSVMQMIAGGLTDDEVSALAAYFGSLSPRADAE
jgi:cytochrome c553